MTVSKEDEEDQAGSIIFATQNGLVKRTKLIDFKNVRKTGIIAIGLKEGDKVIEVRLSTSDEDKIILSGSNGKTVIFDRTQLSPLGRTAQGVKGMKLKGNDKVISLQIADFDFSEEDSEAADTSSNALIEDKVNSKEYPSLLVVTENGFGKQTHLGGYRKTKRAAGGVKTLNMTVKTGKPVLVEILAGDEESLIVTTKKGTTIRISPAEISQLGRNTQGIKVIRLHSNDQVVSGSVV